MKRNGLKDYKNNSLQSSSFLVFQAEMINEKKEPKYGLISFIKLIFMGHLGKRFDLSSLFGNYILNQIREK